MKIGEIVSALLKGPGHIVVDKDGNPIQISRQKLREHEIREAEFRRKHGIKEQGTTITIESFLINFLKRFF